MGVVGLGAALFLLIAMVSLQLGGLVMGPFGRSIANLFYGIAGMCGYLWIALGVIAAIRTLLARQPALPLMIVLGAVIGVTSLATLVHLIVPGYRVVGHGPGGAIGEHFAEILRAVISTAGTALLACVGIVVAVVIATPLRTRDVLHFIWSCLRATGGAIRTAADAFARFWIDVFRAILPDKDAHDEDDAIDVDERDVLEATDEEHGPEPVIIERTAPSAIEVVELRTKKKKKADPQTTELDLAPPEVLDDEPKPPKRRFPSGTQAPELADEVDEMPTDHAGPVIFEPKFKKNKPRPSARRSSSSAKASISCHRSSCSTTIRPPRISSTRTRCSSCLPSSPRRSKTTASKATSSRFARVPSSRCTSSLRRPARASTRSST
jgi:hypothetical protein